MWSYLFGAVFGFGFGLFTKYCSSYFQKKLEYREYHSKVKREAKERQEQRQRAIEIEQQLAEKQRQKEYDEKLKKEKEEEEEKKRLIEEEKKRLIEEEKKCLIEEEKKRLNEEERKRKERREFKRKSCPVCPSKKFCDKKLCRKQRRESEVLCSNCNIYLCSDCWDKKSDCTSCKTIQSMQTFKPISQLMICFEDEYKHKYDCYLKSCKHVYHEQCLLEWFSKEKQCFQCKVDGITKYTLTLDDISKDFFIPLNEEERKRPNEEERKCLNEEERKRKEFKRSPVCPSKQFSYKKLCCKLRSDIDYRYYT